MVAQNSIDDLVSKIAESTAGGPDILIPRPPGLPPNLPRSLATMRAPAPKPLTRAASTTVEASPYTKTFNIGTPSTDKALLASSSSSKSSSSSVPQASEPKGPVKTEIERLQAKLNAMKAAGGVASLLSSSKTSSSTSSSSNKSKSSSEVTALTAESQSLTGTSDELEQKIRAAKLRSEATRLRLEQIEADAELAELLHLQLNAGGCRTSVPALDQTALNAGRCRTSVPALDHKNKNKDSAEPFLKKLFPATGSGGSSPPRKSPSALVPSQNGATSQSSSTRHSSPPPTARPKLPPGSPSPDEIQAAMLQSQLDEVNMRIKAQHNLAEATPEVRLQDEIATLKLEMEMLRKAALNAPVQPAQIVAAKESDKVPVTGSPTPANYKTWRDGVEVSVVSASGRADEAVIFMKEINSSSTPQI